MTEQKLTMSEAADMLTIGEIGHIEKHFGKHFDGDDISGVEQLSSVIWAMERRKPRDPTAALYSWADVEALTMRQAQDYFAPEPVEADETEPESDSGKDDSQDAR